MNRVSHTIPFMLLATCLGCAVEVGNESYESTDSVQSAIVNGYTASRNDHAVAALYKLRSNNKWGFTCSGRVLNPSSNVKAILTARHCVTVDGTINGQLVDPEDRKVTALRAPGYEPNDTTTDFQFATKIHAHSSKDIALIWVSGGVGLPDLYTNMTVGLSPLATSNYVGEYIDQYGYGLTVFNHDPTPQQRLSLGTLRYGLDFEITADNATSDIYSYWNTSAGSMSKTAPGDSGGPSLYEVWPNYYTRATYQLGVHSWANENSTGGDVSIAGLWNWLNDELGYMYLRNARSLNRRAYWANANSQTLVTSVASTSDSWHSKLVYDPDSKVLRVYGSSGFSGKCVDLKWNDTTSNTPFWLWNCSAGSAQRFIVTQDQQLEMEGHRGKCLSDNGTGLVVANCAATSAQTWMFDHNPGL